MVVAGAVGWTAGATIGERIDGVAETIANVLEWFGVSSETLRGPTKSEETEKDDRTANSPLRKDKNGEPAIDKEAEGVAHSQLGTRTSKRTGETYRQGREFDENGNPVKDVDATNHNRPDVHPNPHQHRWMPNKTGGTPQRGPAEPLIF